MIARKPKERIFSVNDERRKLMNEELPGVTKCPSLHAEVAQGEGIYWYR